MGFSNDALRRTWLFVLCACALTVLQACGGGGSSEPMADTGGLQIEGSLIATTTSNVSGSASTNVAAAPRLALIYDGAGSAKFSWEALDAIAQKSGYETKHFKDSSEMIASLDRTSLLIFGGTDDDTGPLLAKFNTPQTIQAMKEFVRKGGVYLGVCGGAYIASEGYDDPKDGEVKALGLAPVRTDSFMTRVAPIIITVTWWGKKWPIYYQFGPKFIIKQPEPASIQVFSNYDDGSIAAIVSTYGNGKVILLGHHPEATKKWTQEDNTLQNAGDWIPTDDLSDDLFAIAGNSRAAAVPN